MFTKENWEREKDQKVAAIDLDGVLVDYPKCWVNWVNTNTQNKFKDLNEMKSSLTYDEYRKLKKTYRTVGVKAMVPAVKDASNFVRTLQEHEYKVIILTSRPYRIYREIYNATLKWLENNKINPDGIIWDAQKHYAVLREFPYLKFMVEDNAELANQVARLGYKVYLLDNMYNKQPLENTCQRVFSLKQILQCENIV